MTELTQNERRTLSVLGFLLLRLGLADRAAAVYDALSEMTDAREKRQALTGAAAALLDLNKPQEALNRLKIAAEGRPLTTAEAAIALLKARALWQQGRVEEARNWRDQYLYLSGQLNEGKTEK